MRETQERIELELPEYNGALMDQRLATEMLELLAQEQNELMPMERTSSEGAVYEALKQRIYSINHVNLVQIALEQAYGKEYASKAEHIVMKNAFPLKRIAAITTTVIVHGADVMKEELEEYTERHPEIEPIIQMVKSFRNGAHNESDLTKRMQEVFGTTSHPGLIQYELRNKEGPFVAQPLMLDMMRIMGTSLGTVNTS